MLGSEKWTKINDSSKRKSFETSKVHSNNNKPITNGSINLNPLNNEKPSFNERNPSEPFVEKISEIQCIGDQSECLTPVRLLKELAQFKALALESSEFNSRESILCKSVEKEEKNLVKMSSKLKNKLKMEYKLDIDLIEKEKKSSAMQTPSFGSNNGLIVGGKHLKTKKMEQINEVNSPTIEEKSNPFEFVERVYEPILKKSKRK